MRLIWLNACDFIKLDDYSSWSDVCFYRCMRISRKETLCLTGIFHKMWRGHNREHVLSTRDEKSHYLSDLFSSYTKEVENRVAMHSYVLMGNHTHECGSLASKDEELLERNDIGEFEDSINTLSHWMRCAHSKFGLKYNKRHNRQGKVAYDRPKTCEIQNDDHLMRVMMYIDANPVRAGLVKHPKDYEFSSYSYYAYGRKNRWTRKLCPPLWYLNLGRTPELRQKRYRQLCDSYLREAGLIDDEPLLMERRFIGSEIWVIGRRELLKFKRITSGCPPS